MTDKQIIYNCPHISLTDWGTYACKLYNPRDKNCLVKGGNCDSNISCPYKQFKAKEQECEELKEKLRDYMDKYLHELAVGKIDMICKLRQTLTEIKPILEFYANSKMGEEQPDRTYKIMCSGGYIMAYDPKPARQALQKISDCEVE